MYWAVSCGAVSNLLAEPSTTLSTLQVVFSDAWWVGKTEDNPNEHKLDMPADMINDKPHEAYDYAYGAGAKDGELANMKGASKSTAAAELGTTDEVCMHAIGSGLPELQVQHAGITQSQCLGLLLERLMWPPVWAWGAASQPVTYTRTGRSCLAIWTLRSMHWCCCVQAVAASPLRPRRAAAAKCKYDEDTDNSQDDGGDDDDDEHVDEDEDDQRNQTAAPSHRRLANGAGNDSADAGCSHWAVDGVTRQPTLPQANADMDGHNPGTLQTSRPAKRCARTVCNTCFSKSTMCES